MWSLQTEDLWQCWIKQVHRYLFSNSIFSPCISMSRLGKFHSVSDFPPVSCFADLWAVAFHGHIVIVLVQQAPCLHKMMNMTDKHSVCLDSPPSITPRLPLLRLPIHRTRNIELMAVDNPIVASKCSIKERVNPCGQLSPFLLLRNCHSHPTIATTTLINHSCQHWGKTLRQPKDSQWRLRWCLEIFSNKVFVN